MPNSNLQTPSWCQSIEKGGLNDASHPLTTPLPLFLSSLPLYLAAYLSLLRRIDRKRINHFDLRWTHNRLIEKEEHYSLISASRMRLTLNWCQSIEQGGLNGGVPLCSRMLARRKTCGQRPRVG